MFIEEIFMALENNKVVSISYTLKDDEGNLIDEATRDKPFAFLSGQNQILPKLEEQIGHMLIGSKKNVSISAEDGYGIYDEKSIREVKRADFPEKVELKEGMQFVADTGEGKHMPFVIKSVKENQVVIDFNHPLAGVNLSFDIELLNVRDATDEELIHGHVHGPGGYHH